VIRCLLAGMGHCRADTAPGRCRRDPWQLTGVGDCCMGHTHQAHWVFSHRAACRAVQDLGCINSLLGLVDRDIVEFVQSAGGPVGRGVVGEHSVVGGPVGRGVVGGRIVVGGPVGRGVVGPVNRSLVWEVRQGGSLSEVQACAWGEGRQPLVGPPRTGLGWADRPLDLVGELHLAEEPGGLHAGWMGGRAGLSDCELPRGPACGPGSLRR